VVHSRAKWKRAGVPLLVAGLLICASSSSVAQQSPAREASPRVKELTAPQWKRLDATVDNGLKFLATKQEPDRSFSTVSHAKPGINGLCVLAFLSRGHLPAEGPYGKRLQRGVEFLLSTQREDGLFTNHPVEAKLTSQGVSHVAMYNHGFAGLALAEVYGSIGPDSSEALRVAIVKGLEFTRSRQFQPKRRGEIAGGFDYLIPEQHSTGFDLPITSGQLLVLRSARNAGFDVPVEVIQEAMKNVKSRYDPQTQIFRYRDYHTFSRGITGAGILALLLGGEHQTQMAQEAGQWLLKQSFEPYNVSRTTHDRFFYSAYYVRRCSSSAGNSGTAFIPRC